MDVFTLFAANAIILLVTAGGFFAIWIANNSEHCWLSWMAANATLAAAVLLFMFMPQGVSAANALPHGLLVLGFGLRWRAARQFTRDPAPWRWILLPVLIVVPLFLMPTVMDVAGAFALVNLVLIGQAAIIAWHFAAHREQAPASSIGLIAAYGVLALSFAMRAMQGFANLGHFNSYIPYDGMLELHLAIAVVHTSASGAFALTIAYERAAVLLRGERDQVMAKARSLQQLAERDALTGLMNRRAVAPRFGDLYRNGFNALAVIDLDHFKRVNDRHGHLTGDEVLRVAATALAPDRDCLAVRIGGEEFMLLLRGRQARERAERRRRAVTARVAAGVPELDGPVTASMGLVELLGESATPVDFRELYAAADRLLYEAKAAGRNRFVAERLTLFQSRSRVDRSGKKAANARGRRWPLTGTRGAAGR